MPIDCKPVCSHRVISTLCICATTTTGTAQHITPSAGKDHVRRQHTVVIDAYNVLFKDQELTRLLDLYSDAARGALITWYVPCCASCWQVVRMHNWSKAGMLLNTWPCLSGTVQMCQYVAGVLCRGGLICCCISGGPCRAQGGQVCPGDAT